MTEDIKFKLITYVDTDFEAKTQKCEYFVELEDGVERPLKDILKENIEQQAIINDQEQKIGILQQEIADAQAILEMLNEKLKGWS